MIQDVDNVNNNVGFWSYSHDFRIVERLTPSFAPFSDAELQAIDNAATRRFVDYQARLGVFAMQQTPGAALGMVYIEEPDGLEHQYLLTDPRQAVDFTNPNSIGTAFGGTTNFADRPEGGPVCGQHPVGLPVRQRRRAADPRSGRYGRQRRAQERRHRRLRSRLRPVPHRRATCRTW